MRIGAMVKTAQGVLNAMLITANPRLEGIVVGTNDAVQEFGVFSENGTYVLHKRLQLIILPARSKGVVAMDGVHNRLEDEAGLCAECERGWLLF